ncbi:hypothetical protein FIBSPDRAFT_862049 [Athelia psychrophila]|uniref:Uncharacterized protein n=1 Tax=Athelia psychrophila TaxID=1759441 RepID=A0A166INR9_9AGAM|nr:hypothetical protein FIBSPDRAFT_862049 [Fibularhizoctonia sp. CBS 109695]
MPGVLGRLPTAPDGRSPGTDTFRLHVDSAAINRRSERGKCSCAPSRTILDHPRMRILVVHVRGELLTAKELQRPAEDMHIADPASGVRLRVAGSSGCDGYDHEGEGYEWAWAEEALKRGTRFVDAYRLAKMEV